ncbi:MAG: hypothetical protein CMA61_04080 [Euryarchaeota archaeon]|nr:hypothetical protein [Euryarchaeota archaeon]
MFTMVLAEDQLISLVLVAFLLLTSRMKDMLDRSGLIAATIVGLVVSLLGHWTWLVTLMAFLIIGSKATNWRYEEKLQLALNEANEGLRSWKNVMANGGAVTLLAIFNAYSGGYDWMYLAAVSSIAVASSDTLASEIGSLDHRTRSITTLEAVPAGTNGGMSPTGTVAAAAGGIFIAIVGIALFPFSNNVIAMPIFFVFAASIGWLGCQVDSLLGALLENRGYIGKHSVNFLATLSGVVMAVIFYNNLL